MHFLHSMLVGTLVGAAAVSAQGACVSTISSNQCTTPASAYSDACTCTGHSKSGAYFLIVGGQGSTCYWLAKDENQSMCAFEVAVDSNCNLDGDRSNLKNVADIACRVYQDTDIETPLPSRG